MSLMLGVSLEVGVAGYIVLNLVVLEKVRNFFDIQNCEVFKDSFQSEFEDLLFCISRQRLLQQ